MKIYIIQSTLVKKETGITKENIWLNNYAVKTEKDARKDCIKFQNKANEEYLGKRYKFVYSYEELTMY